jgi:hypothetical protein
LRNGDHRRIERSREITLNRWGCWRGLKRGSLFEAKRTLLRSKYDARWSRALYRGRLGIIVVFLLIQGQHLCPSVNTNLASCQRTTRRSRHLPLQSFSRAPSNVAFLDHGKLLSTSECTSVHLNGCITWDELEG